MSFWSAWKTRWLSGRPPDRPANPALSLAEGLSPHLRRDIGMEAAGFVPSAFGAPVADSQQSRGLGDIRIYCRLPAFR